MIKQEIKMRQKCGFSNCQQYRKVGSGIQFFSLPLKDQEVCSKWLEVMGKESNKPSKYTAVCSLHFTADDYLKRPGTYVQRLKPNAVPSIIVQGAARIMPIVKEEINVTNIDGPSTSSNNIMDPLGAIVPFVADNTDVLTDCIVLPIESAENKRQLEVNSDDEPLKKKNTSDTPRKVKLKRIVKTLRQKILRKEKKIKSMKQLLGTLTTIVKQ